MPLLQNRRWIWLSVVVLISFLIDPLPILGEGVRNGNPVQKKNLTTTAAPDSTSAFKSGNQTVSTIISSPEKAAIEIEHPEASENKTEKSKEKRRSTFLGLFLMKTLFKGNN